MSNENNEIALTNSQKLEIILKKGLILEINQYISDLLDKIDNLSEKPLDEARAANLSFSSQMRVIKHLLKKIKLSLLILNFPKIYFSPDSEFNQAFEIATGNYKSNISPRDTLTNLCEPFIVMVNNFLMNLTKIYSPNNTSNSNESSDVDPPIPVLTQELEPNNHFYTLPNEVIFVIFSFLNASERKKIQSVSKNFPAWVNGTNKLYPCNNPIEAETLIKNAEKNIANAIQSGDFKKLSSYLEMALENNIFLSQLFSINIKDLPKNTFKIDKSKIHPLSLVIPLFCENKINFLLFKLILIFNLIEEPDGKTLVECFGYAIKTLDVDLCQFFFHFIEMLNIAPPGFEILDLSPLELPSEDLIDSQKLQDRLTILHNILKLRHILYMRNFKEVYPLSLSYILRCAADTETNISFFLTVYDHIKTNSLEFDFLKKCHEANQIPKFFAYLDCFVRQNPTRNPISIYEDFLGAAAEIGSAEAVEAFFNKGVSAFDTLSKTVALGKAIKELHLPVVEKFHEYGFSFKQLDGRDLEELCKLLEKEITEENLSKAGKLFVYLLDQGLTITQDPNSYLYRIFSLLLRQTQDEKLIVRLFKEYNPTIINSVLYYLQGVCEGGLQTYITRCLQDILPDNLIGALNFACEHNSSPMLKILLDQNSEWDLNILFKNIQNTSPDCTLLLIEKIKSLPKDKDFENQFRDAFQKNCAWEYVKLKLYLKSMKSMLRNLPTTQPQSLFGFNYSSKQQPGFFYKRKLFSAACRIELELDNITDFDTLNKYSSDICQAINNYLKDLKNSKDNNYLNTLGHFLGIQNISEIAEINEVNFNSLFESHVREYLKSFAVELNNNKGPGYD